MGRFLWDQLGCEEGKKSFICVSCLINTIKNHNHCLPPLWHACLQLRQWATSSTYQPFTNCWKTIHGLCCIQCHRHQRSSTYLHGTLISLRRPSMGTRGAFRPICSTRPTSIPSCGPAMNQAEKQSTFASPRLYPPSNLSRSSLWTDKTNSSLSCPSLLCSSFVILYWLLYVRRCCIVQLLYKSLCWNNVTEVRPGPITWFFQHHDVHCFTEDVTPGEIEEDSAMQQVLASFRYIRCNFKKHVRAEHYVYEALSPLVFEII